VGVYDLCDHRSGGPAGLAAGVYGGTGEGAPEDSDLRKGKHRWAGRNNRELENYPGFPLGGDKQAAV